MRIIAGTARGHPLQAPRGRGIRPTSDRVRQAIFDTLGQWFVGARVLDLYAGTGAMGLEAISRGAVRAVLVDSGVEACALCRANAASLGFSDRTEVMHLPADVALKRFQAEGATFEVVFADPPYSALACAHTLALLSNSNALAEGARAVIEHGRREEAPRVAGRLRLATSKRSGDSIMSFYQVDSPSARGPGTP